MKDHSWKPAATGAVVVALVCWWSLRSGDALPPIPTDPYGDARTTVVDVQTRSGASGSPDRVAVIASGERDRLLGEIAVALTWQEGVEPEPVMVTFSGAAGSVSQSWQAPGITCELPAGIYEITARGRDVASATEVVRCVGSRRRSVILEMERVATHEVIVQVQCADAPVAGASVGVVDARHDPEAVGGQTDANGMCRLSVDHSWENHRWIAAEHERFGRGIARLPSFRAAEEQRIVVRIGRTATITIRTDPPGQELDRVALVSARARVDRESAPGVLAFEGRRAGVGVWEVAGVPEGRYLITASSATRAEAWHESAFQPGRVAAAMPQFECTGEDAEATVTLVPVYTLEVAAGTDSEMFACLLDGTREQEEPLYADGDRLVERWSWLPRLARKRIHRLEHGRGSIRFVGVRQGEYWLFAAAVDGSGRWQRVHVAHDQRVLVPVGEEGCSIVGKAPGAVLVRAARDGVMRSFGVDADGSFQAEHLEPGSWELWRVDGEHDESRDASQFVFVGAGELVQVRLDPKPPRRIGITGRIAGLGPGRMRVGNSTLLVDGNGMFAGDAAVEPGGSPSWVYTDPNRQFAGRTRLAGSDLQLHIDLVRPGWNLPDVGGRVAKVDAYRAREAGGEFQEASCSWTPPANAPPMPPGRYVLEITRDDGVVFRAPCELQDDGSAIISRGP